MRISKGAIAVLGVLGILCLWEASSLLIDAYPDDLARNSAEGRTSPNMLGNMLLSVYGLTSYCCISLVVAGLTKRRLFSPIVASLAILGALLLVILQHGNLGGSTSTYLMDEMPYGNIIFGIICLIVGGLTLFVVAGHRAVSVIKGWKARAGSPRLPKSGKQ